MHQCTSKQPKNQTTCSPTRSAAAKLRRREGHIILVCKRERARVGTSSAGGTLSRTAGSTDRAALKVLGRASLGSGLLPKETLCELWAAWHTQPICYKPEGPTYPPRACYFCCYTRGLDLSTKYIRRPNFGHRLSLTVLASSSIG